MADGKLPITFTCRDCQQPKTVQVHPDDIKRWQGGVYIQNAMPYLTAAERELFLTQICGDCFDKMFRGEDDDEEFADA